MLSVNWNTIISVMSCWRVGSVHRSGGQIGVSFFLAPELLILLLDPTAPSTSVKNILNNTRWHILKHMSRHQTTKIFHHIVITYHWKASSLIPILPSQMYCDLALPAYADDCHNNSQGVSMPFIRAFVRNITQENAEATTAKLFWLGFK